MDLLHLPHVRGKRANDVSPKRPRRRVTAPVLRGMAEFFGARARIAEAREHLALGRTVPNPWRRGMEFQATWSKLGLAERDLKAIAEDAPHLRRACAAEMVALNALATEATEAAFALTQRERGAAVLDLALARARRTAAAT